LDDFSAEGLRGSSGRRESSFVSRRSSTLNRTRAASISIHTITCGLTSFHERLSDGIRSRQLYSHTAMKVSWFSTYHVHCRVADYFRNGRAFLLGVAVNLAWKLAAVLNRNAEGYVAR